MKLSRNYLLAPVEASPPVGKRLLVPPAVVGVGLAANRLGVPWAGVACVKLKLGAPFSTLGDAPKIDFPGVAGAGLGVDGACWLKPKLKLEDGAGVVGLPPNMGADGCAVVEAKGLLNDCPLLPAVKVKPEAGDPWPKLNDVFALGAGFPNWKSVIFDSEPFDWGTLAPAPNIIDGVEEGFVSFVAGAGDEAPKANVGSVLEGVWLKILDFMPIGSSFFSAGVASLALLELNMLAEVVELLPNNEAVAGELDSFPPVA
ncbi:hypothetical protein F4677DRAFT_206420 [Hypoxylon crocopeplum]|nr:hypothetical protein F4677DRAFT_206420 [Hypoxylon crocopeplum]